MTITPSPLACCKAIAATLLLTTQMAQSLSAQERWAWQAGRIDGRDPRGWISYGIPQTDARKVEGRCGTDGRILLVFGYDVGRRKNGRRVDFQLQADDRSDPMWVSGTIIRSRGEEGLSGFEVDGHRASPVWDLLASSRAASYGFERRGKERLDLRGSSDAISRFLDICNGLARENRRGAPNDRPRTTTTENRPVNDRDTNPRRDNEENHAAADSSCAAFGRIRSRKSRQPVTIRFTNRTRGLRSVDWIDFQGQPKSYRQLNPGESYVQKTFVGHAWMFTDGPGNCKQIFVPRRNDSTFNITFDR